MEDPPLASEAAARLRVFQLVQDLQAGEPTAAGELDRLTASARARGWGQVVRLGLYGRVVSSWFGEQPSLGDDVNAFIDASRREGDECLTALGLALRAAFAIDQGRPASPVYDQDLAQAVVALEQVTAGALERISAHTACGIAFDFRSLWELGDQQSEAALELAGEAEAGIGDTLLAAVMFNRAEANVSWASQLYQLGDTEALQQRWAAWGDLAAATERFAMPAAWYEELLALGQIMAALAGIDVVAETERSLSDADAAGRRGPRATGHLKLARALSLDTHRSAPPDVRARAIDVAVAAVQPDTFPHLHDLALYLGATTEAPGRTSFGLRYARRQAQHRWADRLAQLGAMRSQIAAERLRRELHLVSAQLTRDDLTGIGNRRALTAFTADLDGRGVDLVALIMVDVDHFKQVNDQHGHDTGDAVLARIAQIIDESVRPSDLAIRLGGDEFLVALADADADIAGQRAASIMARIDRYPWESFSPGLRVTVSVGVAAGRRADLDSLRASADSAVYRSKRAGRHRIVGAGPASDPHSS